jgi:1-phosphofructokinase
VGRTEARTVVLAGSLPVGVATSVYAKWTDDLRQRWPAIRVLVDASDEALELALRAAPFFVKPNRVEASALTGRLIDTPAHAAEAAALIAADGPTSVLLSLGAEGAVAAWHGQLQVIESRSIDAPLGQLRTTVGAGDAMVARVAVELAHRDGAALATDDFFDIARDAVREAEQEITGAMPMAKA